MSVIIKLTDIRRILLQTTALIYLALLENCKCQDLRVNPLPDINTAA